MKFKRQVNMFYTLEIFFFNKIHCKIWVAMKLLRGYPWKSYNDFVKQVLLIGNIW